ncbi:GPN-loop GTPase QQT1 [Eumeta japonica]|uniref:GPN-loop GTPase 2 n=1 Tax=Eumeta variegata TaxID=151549 RepID=A0A4C1SQP5_EUMVA|nr:GPN-loop GTPase QQT1 [Eumeta japonica]
MAMQPVKKFKPSQKFYGQLILGSPGAGKTTYCWKMAQLLKKIGRKVVIVNLDPANDVMPYKPDIDIRMLINLEEVMGESKLGPNGALLYCMEYLEKNIDWLLEQLSGENSTNFIFDLPGQVELYCHHDSLKNDAFTSKYKKLNSALVSIIEDYSLVTFQLVDIFNDENLLKVKNLVDKANGYIFKSEEGRHINSMLACAIGAQEPVQKELYDYQE